MSAWLYQMSLEQWPPSSYRLDVWENERWSWPVGKVQSKGRPAPGDRLFFFYAPSGGTEPGFYGWAIVLEWPAGDDDTRVRFRPASPSDHLKMCPWWDDEVKSIVNRVRGRVKQGTVWRIDDATAQAIGRGIGRWLFGKGGIAPG